MKVLVKLTYNDQWNQDLGLDHRSQHMHRLAEAKTPVAAFELAQCAAGSRSPMRSLPTRRPRPFERR